MYVYFPKQVDPSTIQFVRDIATEAATTAAKEVLKVTAEETAKGTAKEVAKDTATEGAKDIPKKNLKDVLKQCLASGKVDDYSASSVNDVDGGKMLRYIGCGRDKEVVFPTFPFASFVTVDYYAAKNTAVKTAILKKSNKYVVVDGEEAPLLSALHSLVANKSKKRNDCLEKEFVAYVIERYEIAKLTVLDWYEANTTKDA